MSSDTTESAWLYDLLAWADINKTWLITAVIALFVGGLAVSVYLWHRDQREDQAYAALLNLGLPGISGQKAPAPSASAYLEVANAYAGTAAAEQARLLAASAAFKTGDYQQAQSEFEKFLNAHADSLLAPTAAFGVAACLDALNRMDDALKAYAEVVSRYPTWANVGEARLAMARLHEAKGQPRQALKIYEDLMAANPRTAWSAQAETRHDDLLRRYPALAKAATQSVPGALPGTNLPAASAPAASNPPSCGAPSGGASPKARTRPATGPAATHTGTNRAPAAVAKP
jgi:predicted negative regulator of RcsB-dependent stress response